jgi:hypothetical protein
VIVANHDVVVAATRRTQESTGLVGIDLTSGFHNGCEAVVCSLEVFLLIRKEVFVFLGDVIKVVTVGFVGLAFGGFGGFGFVDLMFCRDWSRCPTMGIDCGGYFCKDFLVNPGKKFKNSLLALALVLTRLESIMRRTRIRRVLPRLQIR